jgi:YidC/Oxa1 family membrane protein insertase
VTLPLVAIAHTATTVAAKASGGGSILDPIAKPIAEVLAAIYSVFPNYGVAILILSVIWMVLISPLTLKSTRSMLAMQKLQPQLKRLQEQHKDDRQAFAQAQMDLFREHGVSPFGSCLPMLLPLPVFFALFRVIDGLSHMTKGVPTPQFLPPGTRLYKDIVAAHGKLNAFGMDLAKNALSHHTSALAALPYWLILLVMAGTSYLQSAQMMSRNLAQQNNPQMKMMRYLPLLFVAFCIRFPAGVVVYYVMSNVCRIVQQDAMYRFDPKVKALVAREVVEVEEKTQSLEEQHKRGPGYTPPRSARPTPAPAAAGGGLPGGPAATGRSRFRDLLAAAAEQQRTQQAPRQKDSPSNGSAGPRTVSNGSAGGGQQKPPRPARQSRSRKRRRR